MPITLFLDTSALPRNPHGPSAEFRALVEMAEEDLVAVYLSTVAYREWITQQQKQFTDKVASRLRHSRPVA